MNTMANSIRYFKRKYLQYRPLVERLKADPSLWMALEEVTQDGAVVLDPMRRLRG